MGNEEGREGGDKEGREVGRKEGRAGRRKEGKRVGGRKKERRNFKGTEGGRKGRADEQFTSFCFRSPTSITEVIFLKCTMFTLS